MRPPYNACNCMDCFRKARLASVAEYVLDIFPQRFMYCQHTYPQPIHLFTPHPSSLNPSTCSHLTPPLSTHPPVHTSPLLSQLIHLSIPHPSSLNPSTCPHLISSLSAHSPVPTLCRSTAFGLLTALSRVASIISIYTFGSFQSTNPNAPILIVAIFMIFGGLSSLFLPLTKDPVRQSLLGKALRPCVDRLTALTKGPRQRVEHKEAVSHSEIAANEEGGTE